MSEGPAAASDRARLIEINARLTEIANLLGAPETSDGEATRLAGEAAGLVSEALEETERAVAGLESGD